MAVKPTNEEKKLNPFLWFLFVIVIPLAAVLVLTVIILTVSGIDVFAWAKEKGEDIPVLSNVIVSEEEKDQQRTKEKMEQTITTKNEEIASLNQQINDLETTVEKMEQEIVKLENEQVSAEEAEEDEQAAVNESVTAMASSFSDMDNERAAQIIQSLEKDLAVSIMGNVSSDVRGEIFEAMEPDYAAELTQLFVENEA